MSKKTLLLNLTTAIVFALMQGCQPSEMKPTNDTTSEQTKKQTNDQTSKQTERATNDKRSYPIKQTTNNQTSEQTKKQTNDQSSEQTKEPTNNQSSDPVKTKEAQTTDPFEKRCGWLKNPTPGNIWLEDRDQEWTIGIQGGYQAESEKDWWPNFSSDQWVKFHANYGYGCACLDVMTNEETGKILKIKDGQAKSLAACKNDPQLDASPYQDSE